MRLIAPAVRAAVLRRRPGVPVAPYCHSAATGGDRAEHHQRPAAAAADVDPAPPDVCAAHGRAAAPAAGPTAAAGYPGAPPQHLGHRLPETLRAVCGGLARIA